MRILLISKSKKNGAFVNTNFNIYLKIEKNNQNRHESWNNNLGKKE